MAVVDRIPLLMKILFPPLFFLELLRHFLHMRLLIHIGPSYQKACRRVLEPFYDQVRQTLTGKKDPTVLEYGAGPYPAFDAYPKGTHLICIEPCIDFNDHLQDAWNKSHLADNGKFTLINSKIEDLDSSIQQDGSVDLVLSRLVNCSVSNVDATFKTVHRVLKPGGYYYFWDHIRSDNLLIQFVQYFVSLPWFTYFSDCTPTRKPFERLKAAGFSDVKANVFTAPMKGLIFKIYTPTASGYAVK